MGDRAVLLGAGASIKAGVPPSVDMTRAIIRQIDEDAPHRTTTQALNYAYAAMVAHDTAHGGRALDGIDVERLFSAVEMLGQRDELQVAPFVSSWASPLEAVGSSGQFPPFFGDDFQEALNSRFKGKVEQVLRRAIESVAGSSDWPRTYRALQRDMMIALRRLVQVDLENLDYLEPLFGIGKPARIATLNYDLSIELLAERLDLHCDTAVEGWEGGALWKWAADADIQLLKLHGSIDWSARTIRESGRVPHTVYGPTESAPSRDELPGVIFGERGKLRGEGPFIAMLLEFERWLSECDELVVVGYSFRDPHINAAIGRWANDNADAEITLIDPEPDLDPRMGMKHQPFLLELRWALNPSASPKDVEPPQRLRFVKRFAEDALSDVLT